MFLGFRASGFRGSRQFRPILPCSELRHFYRVVVAISQRQKKTTQQIAASPLKSVLEPGVWREIPLRSWLASQFLWRIRATQHKTLTFSIEFAVFPSYKPVVHRFPIIFPSTPWLNSYWQPMEMVDLLQMVIFHSKLLVYHPFEMGFSTKKPTICTGSRDMSQPSLAAARLGFQPQALPL